MSDAEALLAAILSNPEEDTPRLAYADWLDEHDESRRARFHRFAPTVFLSNIPHLIRGRGGDVPFLNRWMGGSRKGQPPGMSKYLRHRLPEPTNRDRCDARGRYGFISHIEGPLRWLISNAESFAKMPLVWAHPNDRLPRRPKDDDDFAQFPQHVHDFYYFRGWDGDTGWHHDVPGQWLDYPSPGAYRLTDEPHLIFFAERQWADEWLSACLLRFFRVSRTLLAVT
jgi:uncharacterized protein (TIGR02996 family)